MKKSTKLIVMIILLLIGMIKGNEQLNHTEVIFEQRVSIEGNDDLVDELLKDMLRNDMQANQYLIRPLEEYPFDCEMLC